MHRPERLSVSAAVCSAETGSGVILMRQSDECLFRLEGAGPQVWRALVDGRSVYTAVERLAAHFDVDRAALEADVLRFAAELVQLELLTVTAAPDLALRRPDA